MDGFGYLDDSFAPPDPDALNIEPGYALSATAEPPGTILNDGFGWQDGADWLHDAGIANPGLSGPWVEPAMWDQLSPWDSGPDDGFGFLDDGSFNPKPGGCGCGGPCGGGCGGPADGFGWLSDGSFNPKPRDCASARGWPTPGPRTPGMDGFASEDDLGWVRPEPFIPAPGEAATPADANAFLAANVNQGAGVKCPGKKTVRVKLREKYITASGWPKKLVIKLATPGWSRKLRKHTSRKHKYCHPCAFHEQNPHLFLKDCSIHYWADITKCHLEMKIGRPRRWGGDSPDQYYYVCPPGHYDLVISCKCQIDPFGLMGFRPVKPKDKANR